VPFEGGEKPGDRALVHLQLAAELRDSEVASVAQEPEHLDRLPYRTDIARFELNHRGYRGL